MSTVGDEKALTQTSAPCLARAQGGPCPVLPRGGGGAGSLSPQTWLPREGTASTPGWVSMLGASGATGPTEGGVTW